MIVAFGGVDVALSIESKLVRHVHRRIGGRTAIAFVSTLAVPRDRCELPRFQVQPPQPLIVEVAEVQSLVGTDDQPVRIGDLHI